MPLLTADYWDKRAVWSTEAAEAMSTEIGRDALQKVASIYRQIAAAAREYEGTDIKGGASEL
jgi:hypothetical protein